MKRNDPDRDARIAEVERIADELWDQSVAAGVPEDATVLCYIHGTPQPKRGVNVYGDKMLCNECVRRYEASIVWGAVEDPEQWFTTARYSWEIRRFNEKCQREGHGFWPFPDGRWAEVTTLYELTEKGDEFYDKNTWPRMKLYPAMFRVWIRSDWQPGEFFNKPDYTLYCTITSNLNDLLAAGPETWLELHKNASKKERKTQ